MSTSRDEAARLQRLLGLRVMGSSPEGDFDDAVLLASQLADVPIALIGLIDDRCQWYKAKIGVQHDAVPREVAVCELVLDARAPVVIEDMTLDPRTRDHDWVLHEPKVRFYAGFPLAGDDGLVVGTLCLVDSRPRVLEQGQRAGLATLARQIMGMLDLRRLLFTREEELARAAAMERELEESRRHYQLLALHSSDIVSRHDATGRVTYVSPSVEQVLGYRPEDELSSDATSHVHPDDLHLVQGALADVADGRISSVTVRVQHADQSWRHMEITVKPLLDSARGLVEVYSAARDVTQRVTAENERSEALSLKRAIMAAIPVGIVSCDADGRLRLFNNTARDFHGVSADVGLDARDWPNRYSLFYEDGVTPLAPEDVPLVRALAGLDVEDVDIVIAPRGMPARLVSCTGRQLRGDDGAVTGAVVSMTDITAIRASETDLRIAHQAAQQAMERLADSERLFKDIFESGPLAIAQLDGKGTVLRANPALRRLLGRTSKDIRARGLPRLVLASDRAAFTGAIVKVSAGAPAANVEARMLLASGQRIWCDVTMSLGTDRDGVSTVLVQIADIDERKRKELQLEQQAARDVLTGLPNRAALQEALQLLGSLQSDVRAEMLFLDIDDFKTINDTHGHHVGDEVLIEVGLRLRGLVRRQDLIVRLGGDEFVILRSGDDASELPAEGTGLGQLAARVQEAFTTPMRTSAGLIHVRPSTGAAHAIGHSELDDLTRRADAAMYDEKRSRRPA